MRVQPAETRFAAFLAALAEHLHADANSEDGLALIKHFFHQILFKSAGAELRHHIVKSAYARQHQLVRGPDVLGPARDQRGSAYPLEHESTAVHFPGPAPLGLVVIPLLRPLPENIECDHVNLAEALFLDRLLEQLKRGVAAVLLDYEKVHTGVFTGAHHVSLSAVRRGYVSV